MIYPSADKLDDWGNKYSLVVLAAKRAKQLKSGAPMLIDTDSDNPLTVALEEIAGGKVLSKVAENDDPPVSQREPEVAQLLAVAQEKAEQEELEAAASEASAEEHDEAEVVLETEEEDGPLDAKAEAVIDEPVDESEEESEDAGDVKAEAATEEPAPKPKRARKPKVEKAEEPKD